MTVDEYISKYEPGLIQEGDVERFLKAADGVMNDLTDELIILLKRYATTLEGETEAIHAISDKYDEIVDKLAERNGKSPLKKGGYIKFVQNLVRKGFTPINESDLSEYDIWDETTGERVETKPSYEEK